MRSYKTYLAMAAVAAGLVGSVSGAGPVDGVLRSGSEWTGHNWNSDNWDFNRYAKDGGIAYFVNTAAWNSKLNQNVSNLKLGGVDTKSFVNDISGNAITFVGERPFISRTSVTMLTFLNQLQGDGNNSIYRIGAGTVCIQKPIKSSAAFVVRSGTQISTNDSTIAALYTDAAVALRPEGGILKWIPGAQVTDPAGVVDKMVVSPGNSRLELPNGGTLTVNELSAVQGGFLGVTVTGNGALGTAAKLKVTDRETDAATELDPSVVGFEVTGQHFEPQLLEYDADDGLRPAAQEKITVYSEDSAIEEDSSALAVKVTGDTKLTIAEGKKLTVGDGVHPGGIIFTGHTGAEGKFGLGGSGFVDFGDKEGKVILASSSQDSARKYYLASNLTGKAGMTFSGYCTNTTEMIPVVYLNQDASRASGWTGDTHFNGVFAEVGANTFPGGGNVFVNGNDALQSATLKLRPGTYNQHFKVRGVGSDKSYYGSINLAQGTTKFTGGMELDGDVRIVDRESYPLFTVDAPISGWGNLTYSQNGTYGQYVKFTKPNSFAGDMQFSGGNHVFFSESGTPGSGKVTAASRLTFNHNSSTIANDIAVSGNATCYLAAEACPNIAFTGNVDARWFHAWHSYGTNSTVLVGTNFTTVGINVDADSCIRAHANDSVVRVGEQGGTLSTVNGTIEDGNGKLKFMKIGTNDLEIAGAKTFTGGFTICGGKVKFMPSLTNCADVAFWYDATDADGITTDANGRIVQWKSKNRNGRYLQVPSGYEGATPNEVDGVKSVRFSNDTAITPKISRLQQDSSSYVRTLFIVLKPDHGSVTGGNLAFFGAAGRDLGCRYSYWGSGGTIASTVGGASYCSRNTAIEMRNNGVVGNCDFESGTMRVLSMRHTYDMIAGQYSSFSFFTPVFGGYATWGNLNYNGDIYESIGFTRMLSQDEIKAVENYLSEKWRGTKITEGASSVADLESRTNLIAAANDLEIYSNSVLDLNGCDQTVAKLSGEGRIENSSEREATLTVSGECTFCGTLGPRVRLVKAGGGESDLRITCEAGSTLEVASGSVKAEPYDELPVTNGILFRLDASDVRNFEFVEGTTTYEVTNWWTTSGSTVERFYANIGHMYCTTYPTYSASSFGGKGALKISTKTQSLFASSNCRFLTCFYVTSNVSGTYLFGRKGSDICIRGGGSSTVGVHGKYSFSPVGALARTDGIDYTHYNGTAVPIHGSRFCLTFGPEPWQNDYSSMNCQWAVGCNMNSNGANQEVGEIIAYDYRLSEAEIVKVERYLMKKWGIVPGEVIENSKVFEAGAALSVGSEANFDASGAPLTLGTLRSGGGTISNYSDLTITGSIVLDTINRDVTTLALAGNVTFGAGFDSSVPVVVNKWIDLEGKARTLVSVNGEVTGDLTAEGKPEHWLFSRSENTWSISSKIGMLLLLR